MLVAHTVSVDYIRSGMGNTDQLSVKDSGKGDSDFNDSDSDISGDVGKRNFTTFQPRAGESPAGVFFAINKTLFAIRMMDGCSNNLSSLVFYPFHLYFRFIQHPSQLAGGLPRILLRCATAELQTHQRRRIHTRLLPRPSVQQPSRVCPLLEGFRLRHKSSQIAEQHALLLQDGHAPSVLPPATAPWRRRDAQSEPKYCHCGYRIRGRNYILKKKEAALK